MNKNISLEKHHQIQLPNEPNLLIIIPTLIYQINLFFINKAETQNITNIIESYSQHINSINSFNSRYFNLPNTPQLNSSNNNCISLTNKLLYVNNEELTAESHILSQNFDELREKIAVVFDTEKNKT